MRANEAYEACILTTSLPNDNIHMSKSEARSKIIMIKKRGCHFLNNQTGGAIHINSVRGPTERKTLRDHTIRVSAFFDLSHSDLPVVASFMAFQALSVLCLDRPEARGDNFH